MKSQDTWGAITSFIAETKDNLFAARLDNGCIRVGLRSTDEIPGVFIRITPSNRHFKALANATPETLPGLLLEIYNTADKPSIFNQNRLRCAAMRALSRLETTTND